MVFQNTQTTDFGVMLLSSRVKAAMIIYLDLKAKLKHVTEISFLNIH